jgi:adenine-specific DNA-methyltransferase
MNDKSIESILKYTVKETNRTVSKLDKLFTENDQLKKNTVLQMQDTGIELK